MKYNGPTVQNANPTEPKFRSQSSKGRANFGANVLRDQLSLTGWILVGAVLQGLATAILPLKPFYCFIPALGLATFKILQQITAVSTYKPGQEGALLDSVTPRFGESDEGVCLLLLGFRNMHPKGLLAEGAKEILESFKEMFADLHKNPQEFGFLGATSLMGVSGAVRQNDLVTLFYFKSKEDLHKFAHSKTHRDGWNWWNATAAKHKHLAIYHETYAAGPGHHESIYINCVPTGLGATSIPDIEEDGKTVWKSPLVSARKNRYRSMMGRMGQTDGTDNIQYDRD